MADAWHGPTLTDETLAFGPLALIAPLLQRLDIAAIIDHHLPPDPQLAFSHGRILSLLYSTRPGLAHLQSVGIDERIVWRPLACDR